MGSGGGVSGTGEWVPIGILSEVRHKELLIFDVGANRGEYVRLVLDLLVKNPPEIHCFEPSPTSFKRLQARFGAHPRLLLNPFGLGEIAGPAKLYADVAGSSLSSLTKRDVEHFGMSFDHVETVSMETLDEYCSRKSIEQIDLLKIDVEGHELGVLTGANRFLKEGRIRMVQFEFGGCNIDTRTFVRDYWRLFGEVGDFDLFRIMPSGHLFTIEAYCEDLEQFRTTNFLVVLDKGVMGGSFPHSLNT